MIRSVIADTARADRPPPADPGFGVYVHWPFCLSKCPYCDFNSHVRGAAIDESRYLAAFKAEIAHRARLAPSRTVRSIFFGGGTPSLMRPER
jgi:coproporphyrinogen III oxidase-like Fe-S oxidoreductase